MTKTQITAEPGLPFIDVVREFDAPRELIYRAHIDPDLIVQWMGPRGYEMVVDSWDVRDGGTWRYTHRDGDGNEYGFHGVFHGPASPDVMVQTFEFEGAPGHVSLGSVAMEEHDGQTRVLVHSVYQSVEDRDAMIAGGMERGMSEGYERLDELVAQLVPVG
jgi:uncharacterized protein YndB with AHSA1/START domain